MPLHDGDIAGLDNELLLLPSATLEAMAEHAKRDLYFFSSGVLGMKDLSPKCHMPLCVFVDTNPAQFKLIMMPRDHFKSSVVTIAGNMQRVVKNPEHRLLIANESATNASRFLGSIRGHAEGNTVFRTLFGKVIPKDTKGRKMWNDTELLFEREGNYPEPTIDSIGMTGAFTSRHYTHIGVDDPISEEALKSDKVMHDVIERYKSFLSLLVDPTKDTITLVGTRWAYNDIYSWAMKEYGPLLVRYIQGAYGPDGHPIFPERFTPDVLALKRRIYGEYKFSCLYLNNPADPDAQEFNTAHLGTWAWSTSALNTVDIYDSNGNVKRSVRLDKFDITITVDLSSTQKLTSDRNAIVVVGVSPWGDVVVLDVWADRCLPDKVFEKLFDFAARYNPRVIGVEAVAYQRAFKFFFEEESLRRGVWYNVRDIKSVTKKEVRIRGLQPLMRIGKLFVRGTETFLLDEMREFPLGQHDDVLDALSMHLQLLEGSPSPEFFAKLATEEERLLSRYKHVTLPIPENEDDEVDFLHLPRFGNIRSQYLR